MGAFQIVAIPSYLWAVGTPPTADAPVGVPTNRRQFEIHPKKYSVAAGKKYSRTLIKFLIKPVKEPCNIFCRLNR